MQLNYDSEVHSTTNRMIYCPYLIDIFIIELHTTVGPTGHHMSHYSKKHPFL